MTSSEKWLTLAAFYEAVDTYHKANPLQRRGQALFNTLHEHRPELANRIRATPTDPFYATGLSDPKYISAIEYIAKNWVKS
jgi:hypothetical protein